MGSTMADDSSEQAARTAAATMPGLPRDEDGPVFREPWEAQAFALAVALNERGVFTWSEWAATLGEETKRAQAAGDPDLGNTYYRHWLAADQRVPPPNGRDVRGSHGACRHAWDPATPPAPP